MPKLLREASFALLLGYWSASLVIAYDIFNASTFAQGFFAFIAPHLAWASGSGVRGSLLVGTRGQKIFGLIAGGVFFTLGVFLMPSEAYVLGFDPITWLVIGFFIGFLITTRQDAANEASTTD